MYTRTHHHFIEETVMYVIQKVLNSSVVLVTDEAHNEFVLLGKGIGFGKKSGQPVDETQVSQIFIPVESIQLQEFVQFIEQVDPNIMELAELIVQFAQQSLQLQLNTAIYYALMDHLQFAVERYHANIVVTNKLYWEIKNYYPKEFEVGEFGLRHLNERFRIHLPEDEAANIAFHIINAQHTKGQSSDSLKAAKLVSDLVNLTRYSLEINFDPTSTNYSRFVTHLKFFADRFLSNQMLTDDDDTLFDQVSRQYPDAMKLTYTLHHFIKSTYHRAVTNEELMYLAVHINRLLKETNPVSPSSTSSS